ncbi:MAG: ATP-binding protein [Candidatus Eisenbacteria bacterium]
MKNRHLAPSLLASLRDSPVVFLQGARQTGKSTLVQALAEDRHPARYLTFDDASVLASAQEDPQAFISGLRGPAVIEEVQRAPELAFAIKVAVDRRRDPGRFLLTGSASVLLLPKIAEALVGRVEIHTLWPFSQGEIGGQEERFIADVFAADFNPSIPVVSDDDLGLAARLLRGGYPVAMERPGQDRRRAWFGSYITTILQRDVRDLASIEGLTAMPRLLALLASRAGSLLNYSELSRSLSMPQTTLKRYMTLLETTFLVQMLPAWSSNLGKRLVKSPKMFFVDTGLLCHLIGLDSRHFTEDRSVLGHVLENFVVMELRKQISWSAGHPEMFHFRTANGNEVDIVLESPGGELVGIEVKSSTTIKGDDFRGLRGLRDLVGTRFKRGIVFYPGSELLAFGPDLLGVPLPILWSGR